MKKWCKIIEVLDNQVLFYMEPESTEAREMYENKDTECLHQVVRIRGVCSDIKIGGIPPDECDKVFESINKELAEMVVKTVEDFIDTDKDIGC